MSLAPSPSTDAEEPPGEGEPGFWRRPGGGRELTQVAMPLVISSLSMTILTFIDRVFLNQVSPAAMAAAFSSSVVWFAALCFPLGLCAYTTTFVSQYLGSGQPKRIGPAVWQGVWCALALSPPILALIPLAEPIFAAADHGPEAMQLEVLYFQILCWGAPGLLLAAALSSFFSGRGKTRVVMIVDASTCGLNLLLDYLLIFGKWGLPEMGIAGAGWATVAALWIKALCYLLLVLAREHRVEFSTGRVTFDRQVFARLLYFGTPSGLQLMLDVMGFTVFIVMVARLGNLEAEATSIAFNIGHLAFMPVWGISQAVSILVGQRLGENRDDLAAHSTWTALVVAMGYMAVISLLFVFVPELFLYAFFFEAADAVDPEHVERVHALSRTLLLFVAAYNLLDAMLMVFVSAIKGAGDTQFVLGVSLLMGALLGGLSWWGVEVWNFGVYACWALIAGWVWTLGLVYLGRFLQGNWRRMRVIEKERDDEPPTLEPAASTL